MSEAAESAQEAAQAPGAANVDENQASHDEDNDVGFSEDEQQQQPQPQRKTPKQYNRGLCKAILRVMRAATDSVQSFSRMRGLVVLGGQKSGKVHVLHLGREWRFVPRHLAFHVVHQVKQILDSHTLGDVVDNLAGL